MTLNIGPQHPATHGTLRIIVRLDGEQVIWAEPMAATCTAATRSSPRSAPYPQVTTLVNRIDWLGSFANEVPFILAAEQLMEIEAPPRAQWIRTILFELAASPTSVCSSATWACSSARITPVFFAFRDREYVLNLIEAVTGGRFHPNFDRIGGLKDDLPKGWIDETKAVMKKLRDFCDEMEDLLFGNEIFQTPHPRHRRHPRRGRPSPTASPAPTSAPVGVDWDLRRDDQTSADGVQQARLEGLDPPRRRPLRPLLGAPAGGPRGHQDRRPAARRHAERPDHGQGPAHHQGARGRGLGHHREPARRDGLLRRQQGRPRPVPGEDPLGQLQQHLDRAVGAAAGVYVPDVITILARLYFILGDIDR